MILKGSVRTSQRTQSVCIIQTNRLALFVVGTNTCGGELPLGYRSSVCCMLYCCMLLYAAVVLYAVVLYAAVLL